MSRKHKPHAKGEESSLPNAVAPSDVREAPAAYQVGFGRPPLETRFKPGQSGNPRGRPKGARNVETILREELFEPIGVMENGRRKKVPRLVALVRRAMEKGFAGDMRAALALVQIARQLSPDETKAAFVPDLSPDEDKLLDLLAARAHTKQVGKNGGGGHE